MPEIDKNVEEKFTAELAAYEALTYAQLKAEMLKEVKREYLIRGRKPVRSVVIVLAFLNKLT